MRPLPSEHWVCFSCRKQFRKPRPGHGAPRGVRQPLEERVALCPECGAALISMGKYFRPPRREDRRAWAAFADLAEHGVRFHSEGVVAFTGVYRGTRIKRRRAAQIIGDCPCHTRTEGQRLLRVIAGRQRSGRRRG